MAVAYLNEGSVTIAAAAWSDATGFANAAELAIINGNQTIITSLDQSALGTGIAYLDVRNGFEGNIGSDTAGPLICDVDGGSPNRIRYAAKRGKFYYRPGGGSTLCTDFHHIGGGESILTGAGTITNLEVAAGKCTGNGNLVVTNLVVAGGSFYLDEGTDGTLAAFTGGTSEIRRGFTTINVHGPAKVSKTRDTSTVTTVNLSQGTLAWWEGAITTMNWYSGVFDPSNVAKDLTISTLNVYPGVNPDAVRALAATVTVTTTNYKAGGPKPSLRAVGA